MSEMNTTTVKKMLSEAPFFSMSKVGDDLFKRFSELKTVIQKRGDGDSHQLNRNNVTGIWYLSGLHFEEGAPQILVRTSLKKKSYEHLLMCAEIHEFAEQDVAYDYDTDLAGDNMIIGQQKELFEEIAAGRVLTIYDKEREI